MAAVVAMLLCFPLLKALYFKKIYEHRKYYFSFLIGSLLMLLFLILPHLFFNRYITLWENNPMLAEFPTVWTIYSELNAVVFVLSLFLFLQVIKKMVVVPENISTKLFYNITLLLVILGAGFLNILEDRYLYQPVLDGYLGLFNDYKIAILSFIVLTSAVSVRGNWIHKLDQRSKILCLISGIFSLLIIVYLFSSQYIVAVYAFSTTLKGFVLLGYLYLAVFFAISVLKLLVYLPTAARIDRTSQELQFITEIEKMVRQNSPLDSLLYRIVEQSMKITESNACWFEMIDIDERYRITHSFNVKDEIIDSIGSFTIDDLKKQLVGHQQFLLINNVRDHAMTKNFRYLDLPWKSLLAIPIIKDKRVIAVLYTVKNRSNGFSMDDNSTLGRFLIHLEKVFSNEAIESYNQDETNDIHFEIENYIFDVIGSKSMIYDFVISGQGCCLFGVLRELSRDKIAELRGSLKILLQMNSPIEMVRESIGNVLSLNENEYFFLFFRMDSGALSVLKSSVMCYGLCDQTVTLSHDPVLSLNLHKWGVFCLGQEKRIDISRIAGHYENEGFILDLKNNFSRYFEASQPRENIVLIQVNSKN
ncbi:MAG: GAF domain-containing protein [Candidatus Marinimicrobia bacterium]|nr:GAF domain-containing protein [Candidatus Neomarinimicrobiota bacterium]